MEVFKEFQGKDLDDAISRACAYFDVPREKLEIDIVRDSKSGIFGIVGARKAMIKARRAKTQGIFNTEPEECSKPESEDPTAASPVPAPAASSGKRGKHRVRQENDNAPSTKTAASNHSVPPKKNAPAPAESEEDEEGESQTLFLNKMPPAPSYADIRIEMSSASVRKPARPDGRSRPAVAKKTRSEDTTPQNTQRETFSVKDLAEEGGHEGLPELPFEELDCARLEALSLETVQRLIQPITGPADCELRLEDGRVYISIACGENSGALIGREGQTLAALQYIASRIVSRAMNAAVRINLDAGSYRQRQDDKLRELALNLADRVKNSGKAYSTRPLSSYHRRIIHLTLQDDEEVHTRSTGEGTLKRVVVQRRR